MPVVPPEAEGGSIVSARWIALIGIALLALLAIGIFALRPPAEVEDSRKNESPRILLPGAPIGLVAEAPDEVRWDPVPDAKSYEIEFFDATGALIEKRETEGVRLPLPAGVESRCRAEERLFYRIRAIGGWGKELARSERVLFRYEPALAEQ